MAILCERPERAAEVIGGIGGEVRTAGDLAEASRLLHADGAETLVVVGAETDAEEALAFAARLRVERPAVGVVLVRRKVDVALLTRALQAGVREVVPAGDVTALSVACARSRELSWRFTGGPTEPVREGQVATVFSAKGGCGKTTLAVNLSAVLAAGGRRRVCLVDLDLAFGDVGISLQLDPVRTIVDGLGMVGHLDERGAGSLLTEAGPGFATLLAPVEPGDAERVPAPLVAELLVVLRGMFDYVVVDTPSQFSEHVLAAMDASAHHVLLTTPDVPALKNLRVTLDMLDLLSYRRDIRSVVLNRSDAKVGLSEQDVERVVRAPISARVPSSRDVPISTNRGVPITVATPAHPVSTAVARFAQARVLGEPVAPSRRSWRRRGAA
ncbi:MULTISPECIES: AAA family ATPase [unclassified Saccharothrix]|uniref:AAA family ATPase n=1 Tax=unclassified Saccharothrix TaxID=2593673 RepID=UPI00307F61B2